MNFLIGRIYTIVRKQVSIKKRGKNQILYYSDDIEKAMEIILRSHGGKDFQIL